MNKRVAFSLPIAMMSICAMLIVSCTSSDINDVYKGPNVEADKNPLGSLTPSASFMWSTMEHSNVTIEVDDHFDNQYDYYVNLYAENPRVENKPNALFSGVARGNKPANVELDLPGSATNIYVEVKDPQGYVMVYGYAAPKAGANVTLPCVIGEPAQGNVKDVDMPSEETRSLYTQDFDKPEAANAPSMDWTVPSDAQVLPDADKYDVSAIYKVPANTTVTLTGNRAFQPAYGGKVRILVEGTLDIQNYSLSLLNNVELYVLDGGKVTGRLVVLQENAILAIENGAVVELESVKTEGRNAYFFNAGVAYISKTLNFNQSNGNIYVAPTGRLVGAAKDSEALENKAYTMSVEHLQGQMFVDANEDSSGQFLCGAIHNYVSSAKIVVNDNAHMYVSGDVNFQCTIFNAGLFTANSLDGGKVWEAQIINTCTMIVKESIKNVGQTKVKGGTISGGVTVGEDGQLEFTPLPEFDYGIDGWGMELYLIDGSYVDVQNFTAAKAYVQGKDVTQDPKTSLIRIHGNINTRPYIWGAGIRVYYNLVMELDMSKVQSGSIYNALGGAVTSLSTASIEVDNCTGNIPTRIEDDDDDIIQTNPYVGSVQSGYTVNFEDQWPVIGDYDVNDIVLHTDKIETLQTATKVKEVTFTLHLLAVGANYTLGAGLQLDNITHDEIASVEYSAKGQAGMMDSDAGAFKLAGNGVEKSSGSSKAVLPLFYDAHKLYLHKTVLSAAGYKPLNTGSTQGAGTAFTIKVTFADDATVTPEDLMVSSLNFFIFRPKDEAAVGGKRVEVHLKGYAPTRLATDVYYGKGNDSSTENSYYVSKDGFPWGIIVNDINGSESSRPWHWPSERKLITNEYGSFAQWVNSNGTDATDWMMKEID